MALDAAYRKLVGTGGRLFADPQPSPDETSFMVDNTSEAYYDSPYYTLHKNDLQPVPVPRVPDPRVDLTTVSAPTSWRRSSRRTRSRSTLWAIPALPRSTPSRRRNRR